jgi:hypothetical protein
VPLPISDCAVEELVGGQDQSEHLLLGLARHQQIDVELKSGLVELAAQEARVPVAHRELERLARVRHAADQLLRVVPGQELQPVNEILLRGEAPQVVPPSHHGATARPHLIHSECFPLFFVTERASSLHLSFCRGGVCPPPG